MTTMELNLPDDLAQRAKSAGLLSNSAIKNLLEEAMRREAGRKLLSMAERLQAANIPPMTEAALDDLIHDVRATRRASNAGGA